MPAMENSASVHALGPVFGLPNLGNTCYLNSIVVALSASVSMRSLLEHAISIQSGVLGDENTHNFLHILWRILNKGKSNDISELLDLLFDKFPRSYCHKFQQQDAHEVFNHIIQLLDEEIFALIRKYSRKALNGTEFTDDIGFQFPIPTRRTSLDSFENSKKLQSLFFEDLRSLTNPFTGSYFSLMNCSMCLSLKDALTTPFSCLSLSFPSQFFTQAQNIPLCSLEECIEIFFANERIEEVLCDRCRPYLQTASRQLLLCKFPRVLCIHLNRLLGDWKVYGEVLIPRELNLAAWKAYSEDLSLNSPINLTSTKSTMSKECLGKQNSNLTYHIRSVIVHQGNNQCGHYITYRLHSLQRDEWVCISDTKIRRSSWDEVKRIQAYMIFYEVA